MVKQISKAEADALMDKFLREEPLQLNETVFILEKLVRNLITEPEEE